MDLLGDELKDFWFSMGNYSTIPLTEKSIGPAEHKKIMDLFQLTSKGRYEIDKIKLVSNPQLRKAFESHFELLQIRNGKPEFQASWEAEAGLAHRKAIMDRFKSLVAVHQPQPKAVPVSLMWYGLTCEQAETICNQGFSSAQFSDIGFGNGVHLTDSVEVTCQGKDAVALCWVLCGSVYPVIPTDWESHKLQGNSAYKNYDSHFIPLAPFSGSGVTGQAWVPASENSTPTHNQLVCFTPSQVLVHAIVYFHKQSAPTSAPGCTSTAPGCTSTAPGCTSTNAASFTSEPGCTATSSHLY